MIGDEHQFFLLRQKLFAQPTYKQAEVIKRVAAVEIINHEHHGQKKSTNKYTSNNYRYNLPGSKKS